MQFSVISFQQLQVRFQAKASSPKVKQQNKNGFPLKGLVSSGFHETIIQAIHA